MIAIKEICTLKPGTMMPICLINDAVIAHIVFLGEDEENRFSVLRESFGVEEKKYFHNIFAAIYWMLTGEVPLEMKIDPYEEVWSDYAQYYCYIIGNSEMGFIFIPDDTDDFWTGFCWTKNGTDFDYFKTEKEAQDWVKEKLKEGDNFEIQ